jgi:hypothetical protein
MFQFRLFNKLRFRFHYSKIYGSYGSGSGSTTLVKGLSHEIPILIKANRMGTVGTDQHRRRNEAALTVYCSYKKLIL